MRLNILALETSSQHCSVALQYGTQVATRLDSSALSHSRSLLSMIDEVLKEAKLSLSDLNGIAVTRGPGSFTGLRIGIAVAQGLAFGHQLPVVPISSLSAVAYNAFLYWQKQSVKVDAVLATMDARMGEVYCGWYDLRHALPVLTGAEHVLKPELLSQVGRPDINGSSEASMKIAIAGQGLHYLVQYPESLLNVPSQLDVLPDATALLPLALRDFNLGKAVDAETLTPVYLRDNVTY